MITSPIPINTFGKNIIPLNDAERLEALYSYNILDSPPEKAFDNLAHIIADDFDVPIALISLVDKNHVFFKANVGMNGVRRVERGISLCSLAILSNEPTIFEKPMEEPCLLANPLVQGAFGLRFYAGAPIITADGFNIGTVCIVDKKERHFTKRQEARLVRYAQAVMHEISIRQAVIQKTAALEEATKHRQKIVTEAVITAQENERSLIGLELHDNINQVLTTVKLYNQMVMEGIGETRTIMEKSSGHLQYCIDEIRSISKRLSAPTLGKISLEESIKDLIGSINLTNKLEVNYSISGIKDLFASQELHLAIYRIVQEQLNNIIKHARASYVSIELHNNRDRFQILIRDNGDGFDTNRQRTGIGITNMRTRSENLNGKFNIISAPGKGCLLHIDFPPLSIGNN
jgi:signal transduction histidine kinase